MATDVGIVTTPPVTKRWRRFEPTVPIRVKVDKLRQVTVISCRGFQVNVGGLAFLADTYLTIGDEAEIELTDYGLTLGAVVRNRAGNRHGVKFLGTSAEDGEQLGLFRKNLRSRMGSLNA